MEVPTRTLEWLLDPADPPVRYLALTEVLGLDRDSDQARGCWGRRMDYRPTREILAQGHDFWTAYDKAYGKYTGMYWQAIFLGAFFADGADPRLRPGLELLLADRSWVHPRGMQCLTANVLRALVRMGLGDHRRVGAELDDLAVRVLRDGGVACDAMAFSLMERCCMSVPKLVACFAEVPAAERSEAVREALALLVDRLLSYEVLAYLPGHHGRWQREVLARAPKASELPPGKTVKDWVAAERERFLTRHGPGGRQEKPGWRHFGFSKHYDSDALEASYALARAGVARCAALERALELIASKADAQARWRMEDSLNGKMRVDVETKGAPSKWLTCHAIATLRHFGELEPPSLRA